MEEASLGLKKYLHNMHTVQCTRKEQIHLYICHDHFYRSVRWSHWCQVRWVPPHHDGQGSGGIHGELRDYSNRCLGMFSLPNMEDNELCQLFLWSAVTTHQSYD